jgi:hypothetical protein
MEGKTMSDETEGLNAMRDRIKKEREEVLRDFHAEALEAERSFQREKAEIDAELRRDLAALPTTSAPNAINITINISIPLPPDAEAFFGEKRKD